MASHEGVVEGTQKFFWPLGWPTRRGSFARVWLPDESRLVKVRLQSNGEDVEMAWAEDCGSAPGHEDGRHVRLGNVPFLHAKPTYGDLILATPDPNDGMLMWDDGKLQYERIGEKIIEDGGRWAMILDYELLDPTGDAQEAFSALDCAGEKYNVAVEGFYGPRDDRPGRAYLAVPQELERRSGFRPSKIDHLRRGIDAGRAA